MGEKKLSVRICKREKKKASNQKFVVTADHIFRNIEVNELTQNCANCKGVK